MPDPRAGGRAGAGRAIHGEAALEGIPRVFERNRNEAEGGEQAARSIASFNLLRPEVGYDDEHAGWATESQISTRLSEPTTTLRLARWDGSRLWPMCGEPADPQRAWALSEVTVRASRVKSETKTTDALSRAVAAAKASGPGTTRRSC